MTDGDNIITHCLILGGGVAGLTCAHELAARGYTSVIIEKAPFLGGHAAKLVCKATTTCQNCGACLAGDCLKEIREWASQIVNLTSAHLERLHKDGSFYDALVVQNPTRIVPDLCNSCGECLQACPESGAIRLSPFVGIPYIHPKKCSLYFGNPCSACADVCRSSAVKLLSTETEFQVKSKALVIATGFTPFNPALKPRLGYGRIPGVLTALELEELLRNDQLNWNPHARSINRVAFIQCVGSRDAHLGHNYCSQVCCAYALRMARLIKAKKPHIDITVFYMDIQSFERNFQRRLREAEAEINLCRAMPSEVRPGKEGSVEVLYHNPLGSNVWESFDLVVLSIGISPPDPTPALAFVAKNSDGFFEMAESDAIFVAGASSGPKSIVETIRQAAAVAEKVAFHLQGAS